MSFRNAAATPRSTSAERSAASPWMRAVSALTYPLSPGDFIDSLLPQTPRVARGRVEKIERNGLDAATITIRCPRGWKGHQAGQFMNVGVDIDGVRHTRCYSISSAPERNDGCFTITAKAIDNGRVSNHLVDNLVQGDVLLLGEPTGEFVLPQALPQKLLLIAAGSGITPVISMLESLQAQDRINDIVVIHSAPSPEAMIFGDALEQMAQRHAGLSLHRFYTQHTGESKHDGEHRGRFVLAKLSRLCADWQDRQVWACGPDALLQSLEQQFDTAGIADHLHVERFRPKLPAAVPGETNEAQVQFSRSAVSATGHDAQSLLELAEASGLSPEHGCRMGICHGCTTTLKAGCVRDMRNGELFNEEGDLVQICVCAPVGNVDLEL